MLNDIMRIAINLGPSRRGLNVLCRVHATLAEAEDIGLTKPTKPAEARRIDSIAGKVCRTCGFGIKDHPKGDCPSGGSWRPPHCH
jgi:rubrerythrin